MAAIWRLNLKRYLVNLTVSVAIKTAWPFLRGCSEFEFRIDCMSTDISVLTTSILITPRVQKYRY